MRCDLRGILLFCFVLTSIHPALTAGQPFDAATAIRAAAETMAKDHLRQWPLDDKLSRLWLASLIQGLDPDALLFLQADLDELAKYADRLDDFAREGNLEFSNLVRKRWQERTSQAMQLAERQIVAQQDFTLAEEVPRQYANAPADAQELTERWRRRIKLELLIEKVHGRNMDEVQHQFALRYERLRRQAAEINNEQWLAHYIDALIACYDPASFYFTPTDVIRLDNPFRIRSFLIDIKFTSRGGKLLIAEFPGRNLSLQQQFAGFQVLAIRQLDNHLFDVVGLPNDEFYDLVRRIDGPLGEDSEIILELLEPVTLERRSVKCSRHVRVW